MLSKGDRVAVTLVSLTRQPVEVLGTVHQWYDPDAMLSVPVVLDGLLAQTPVYFPRSKVRSAEERG